MGKWLEGRQEEAKKILGDKAEFPAEKPDMSKLQEEYAKKRDAFEEARTKIEDAIQEFEDAITTFQNGLKTNRTIYDKDDYGLDPKDKEDKKKIDKANKIFMEFFTNIEKNVTDRFKEIDELNKHAIQMRKYAPPKTIS